MYDMIIRNSLNHYCLAEVDNEGKIQGSKQLPEFVFGLKGFVYDEAIIKWFKERKSGLGPDFLFKKCKNEICITSKTFKIRVDGEGWVQVESKKSGFQKLCKNFKSAVELAKDLATIFLYDEEIENEKEAE